MYYEVHSTLNPIEGLKFEDVQTAWVHVRNLLDQLEADGDIAQASPYASGHPMKGWVQVRIMLADGEDA